MNRSVRHGLLFAVVALIAVAALHSSAALNAAPTKYPIKGISLSMYLNAPPTFDPYNSTDKTVTGTAYPVILLCPAATDVVTDVYTRAMNPLSHAAPCETSTGDGFRGWLVTKETAVRNYTNPISPTMVATATLAFSGQVDLNGKTYFGSLMITQVVSGPLYTPVGIDSTADPGYSNPPVDYVGCGAKGFSGRWEIVPGQGSGDLRAVVGNGTVTWDGLGSFPVQLGNLWLQYDTFLPLLAKN